MPQQLVSSCVAVASIDAAMRQSMFALFIEHYDGVSCDTFLRDLAEKEWAILLHDDRGTLRGFSTLRVYARNVRGMSLRLLFSGDTIIEPTYWGEQTFARAWCDVAGRLAAAEPETPMYWLLLSKGFRTYLYLPLFFAEFWPRRDAGMPSFERAVIDDFASFKYGDCWRPERGVITFDEAPGRLRGELAEIAPHRLQNEDVRFFAAMNPRWRDGDELVCLARLDEANLRSFARRVFRAAAVAATAREMVIA